MTRKQITIACGAVIGSFLIGSLSLGGSADISVILGITFLAIVFWFAELLPLHITGLVICLLLIVFGGQPAEEVFGSIFDPVVVLLFGGLVLAVLLQSTQLDRKFVGYILNKESYSSKTYLLFMMVITAFLSMRISNTAAAALMIPLVVHVVETNTPRSGSKNGFAVVALIGTAYAATLGGIASLVGSPPNALAVAALSDLNISFGFIEWMLYALPVTTIMIFIAWKLLLYLFPYELSSIYLPKDGKDSEGLSGSQKAVLGIFLVTVVGWVTSRWTGLASSSVALLPLIGGSILGVLPNDYIKKINRGVLLLIGSGIALGNALYASGTASFLTDALLVYVDTFPRFLLLLILGVFGVLLTMFASNTASAALLLPLVAPIGVQLGMPLEVILFVGISVSLDFTAPMGTPPNALAYSTGMVSIRDMAKAGLLLSLLSVIVVGCISFWVRPFFG